MQFLFPISHSDRSTFSRVLISIQLHCNQVIDPRTAAATMSIAECRCRLLSPVSPFEIRTVFLKLMHVPAGANSCVVCVCVCVCVCALGSAVAFVAVATVAFATTYVFLLNQIIHEMKKA